MPAFTSTLGWAEKLPLLNHFSIHATHEKSAMVPLVLVATLLCLVVGSTLFLLQRYGKERVPEENGVRVTQLLIHPIKSCRGTSMNEVRYTANGVDFDRQWVIIQRESHKFITAREQPTMVLITPKVYPERGIMEVSFPKESGVSSFAVPLRPDAETLKSWEYITDVGFWSGAQLDGYVVGHSDSDHSSSSQSPSDLLSEFLNIPVLLILKGPKRRPIETTPIFPSLSGRAQFQDGFPLFLTSMESLRDLTGYVGVAASGKNQKWRVGKLDAERWKDGGKLEMERFRPNIVVSGLSKPWLEDTWAEIAVGDPLVDEKGDGKGEGKKRGTINRISLVSKGTRCLLPNVNPADGVRDDAVPFKVMAKFRNVDPKDPYTPCFGVNGVPVLPSPSPSSSSPASSSSPSSSPSSSIEEETELEPEGWIRVGDRVRVTRVLNRKELELVTKGKKEAKRR